MKNKLFRIFSALLIVLTFALGAVLFAGKGEAQQGGGYGDFGLDCSISYSVSGNNNVNIQWNVNQPHRTGDYDRVDGDAQLQGPSNTIIIGSASGDGGFEGEATLYNLAPGSYTTYVNGYSNAGGGYWTCTDSKSFNIAVPGEPPVCAIASFTAGNSQPAYNTSTTLTFSLNDAFPWSIQNISGGANPSPSSGNSSGATVSTGNLTSAQTYRLTCGGQSQDRTVFTQDEEGNVGGSVCNDPAANNYGASGGCTYSGGGGLCSPMTEHHAVRGCWDWTWDAPVYKPDSASCLALCNSVSGADACEWDRNTGDCYVEYSSGGCYVEPGFGGWDASVADCPPVVPPMTGSIVPSSPTCNIPQGAANCEIPVSWYTNNPQGTSSITTSLGGGASGNNGTNVAFNVPYGSRILYLYNNGQLLDQKTINSVCTGGTVWNGSSCQGMSGDLSGPASCTISSGSSTCNVTLTWNTVNPQGTSAVTATGMANVNGNSGSQPFTVPYNSRTFYLYNNAQLLDQHTVNSSCESGSVWNGSSCAAIANGVCSATHYNCSSGTSANNGESATHWIWNCNGVNGGTNTSCTEAKPVNGACSSSHYNCSAGNSANNAESGTQWTWSCNGTNGGSNASCSENKTCPNGATNPPVCTGGGGGICLNDADNHPDCTVLLPPGCPINSTSPSCIPKCVNGATNPPTCTTDPVIGDPGCPNGATNPPTCTTGIGTNPVNAYCAPMHYGCYPNTIQSTSRGGDSSNWTWTCLGLSGGSNASCTESKRNPVFKEN